MYKIPPEITKELILESIPQEEIFRKYLGIEVEYNELLCSPIRRDVNPTCSFKWFDGKLYFRDFSEVRAKDCFNVVQEVFSCNFYAALHIIARDFNIIQSTGSTGYTRSSVDTPSNSKGNSKSIIQVRKCRFRRDDINYLRSYHINSKICKRYNVYSVDNVWLNGERIWTYRRSDPAIGYYFGLDKQGNQKWKIYFYKRKDRFRFLTNTNRINGWIQIPEEGDLLIITKALKDVMCLDVFGIPAIAMQSETTIPYDYIIGELQNRFTDIYTLFDFDKTGIRMANIIKREYDIKPLLLTNGRFNSVDYGYKDFSDYLKGEGFDSANRLIEHTKELINN